MKFDFVKHYKDEKYKLIILDPLKYFEISEQLQDKEREVLEKLGWVINEQDLEYFIEIVSYDNYKLSTLLDWLLPIDKRFRGFAIAGHIAHVNLKEDLHSFKYAIGELILDKVPRITCVVSKIIKENTQCRQFQLDLLAGEANFITSVKEHGYDFVFDFSKVFWNSRLSSEHFRIVESFQAHDVVYDACAGVGPFAIPAAKKGCRVIANDLNEESCKWFRTNIASNSTKRKPVSVELHNLSAPEFIEKVVLPDIVEYSKCSTETDRFYLLMNLPSVAINFLSSIIRNDHIALIKANNVFLHVRCYCFIGKENPQNMIEEKIEKQLGERVVNYNLRMVRDVASQKDTFCAEILVNLSPLTANQNGALNSNLNFQ